MFYGFYAFECTRLSVVESNYLKMATVFVLLSLKM